MLGGAGGGSMEQPGGEQDAASVPDVPLPVRPAKSRTRKLSIHPAPYPQYLVPHITELLQRHIGETSGHEELLDCCAGLGKELPAIARALGLVPIGIELEQGYFDEGATDPCVIQGNARFLPFGDRSKRAGVTSFVYPNGCADDFQANDSSIRNTYPHRIRAFRGKDYVMHPDNMGAMSPRRSPKAYQTFLGVQDDIIAEMHRVLDVWAPFAVNTKDPRYYLYTDRTWRQLLAAGFAIVEHREVNAKGLLYGEHYDVREEFEHLTVAIRLPDGVIESEARVPWPRHSSAS